MSETRRATENTMNEHGQYWGCWVVANLNTGKLAVLTTRSALQKATMSCSANGDLYHVEAILFEGILPTSANIHLVISDVKNTYLTDDKMGYFQWLKATTQAHLYEPKRDISKVSLAERLHEILSAEKERSNEE